jgi:DICT domain-containing protein
MSNGENILSKFLNKLLPLFPERQEDLLRVAPPTDLQRLNFRYVFSVQAMTTISHIIEDFVMDNPGAADMHVSFQLISRFANQAERYEHLADVVKGLWLYGVMDATLPDLPRRVIIDTGGTLLEKYWFVIAYGPGIHMTLIAEEIEPSRLSGKWRMYEGVYTFDPNLAYKAISLLHLMYPEQVPNPLPPELIEG